MPGGPQPVEHEQRVKLAREIAGRALEVRGEHTLAIGLYGSTGRGTDGPYFDIEILCVLEPPTKTTTTSGYTARGRPRSIS